MIYTTDDPFHTLVGILAACASQDVGRNQYPARYINGIRINSV